MSNDQQVMLTVLWTMVATLAVTWLSVCIYSYCFKKRNSSSNSLTADGKIAASTAAASLEGQNYEVFLSFRGEDTRKNFTDHLYHRLTDVGISVFRDNEELHVGEEIHPNLLRAIQSSRISIPIISPDYASSKWCLHELVQILKCKETLDQIVIPIFYHVNPSDVRNQSGSFGKAFSTQKKKNSMEDVQGWKEALKKVALLRALELNNDGYEGKLAKQVVEMVLTDLKKTTQVVPEYLVGVGEQSAKIMKMIDVKSSHDVQLVLIHGMGGIGKTTLAKFLYNQLSSDFKFHSFLGNIREMTTLELQKKLISNILRQDWPHDIYHVDDGIGIIKSKFKRMKVLLVLDDVDNIDQVKALVGRCDYFGFGSIIIFTSRNRDVLNPWQVKVIFELKELQFAESFQLFCKHALQREYFHLDELKTIGHDVKSTTGRLPLDEFETIGRDILSTTGGLPLAIEVIGSLLQGKGLDIWKETLKRLKRMPADEVHLKLKLSYEALTYEQQAIFLDIACLFPSLEGLTSFIYMWDDCDYYPRYGLEVLKSLSLVKVGYNNSLIMHEQVRQLGREIVIMHEQVRLLGREIVTMHEQVRLLGREIIRQESPDLLGRRRILWDHKEAYQVIKGNQGTDQIQVLNLALDKRSRENCFTSKQFERLIKLRYLQMSNVNLVGNFKNCFLNLRWLQWHGCPSSFMATGFRPEKLVVLNLSKSKITEHWGGWNEIKYAENLKVLKLRKCSKLEVTPDFSAFKDLEMLDLSFCERLRRIHPSICRLSKTLKTFNVTGCEKLEDLPKEIGEMEELGELYLDRTSIREIPVAEGSMTKLKTLSARNCSKLPQLPESIGSLKKLQGLIMRGCKSLTLIPESIGKGESLSELDLGYTNVGKLPESIGNLHGLKEFTISGTPIETLPAAIGMLKKLETMNAKAIHGLTEVPKEIGELTRLLHLNLDGTPITVLPNLPGGLTDLGFSGCSMESLPNVSYLMNLQFLTLKDMVVIPELPSNLTELQLCACRALHTLPNFSNLKNLYTLFLEDCTELIEINALEEVQSLRGLEIRNCKNLSKLSGVGKSLRKLWLCYCNELKSLPDLSVFKNLTEFLVIECNDIVEIQGLDSLECVRELYILDCSSLEKIGDFSHLTMLHQLGFGNCPKLRDSDYPCIDKLTSLELLCLFGGSPALRFPDLTKLGKLERLSVNYFEELTEIPNLQELKSLAFLDVSGCKSLEDLPDFSEFDNLTGLIARGCEKLTEFKGLENLNSFCELGLLGCRSLKQLPDLPEWIMSPKNKWG